MKDKPIRTAKELVFAAWCEGRQVAYPDDEISEHPKWKERFENWWMHKVWSEEHRGCFVPEHSVFINGHRYIRAE